MVGGRGLLLALALAGSAGAAPVPSADGSAIGVLDAVEVALRHNPGLRIAELSVDVSAALLLQQQASFDPELSVNVSLEYRQEALTQRELQAQIDQRNNIQTVMNQFSQRVTDQRQLLDEFIRAQQDPDNFSVSDTDAQNQLDLINELIASAPTPQAADELRALRAQWLERRRNEVQDTIDELRDNEASERERLQKLGDIPTVNISYFSRFDAAWRQPYRNGNVATWFADLQHDGTNFRGKPRDPAFGGKGIIDVYKSRVGVTLDLPLGQGGGRFVTTAFERAAESDLTAQAHRLTHQAATVVARTADAYWSLVAAQMRRDVLKASLLRQGRLLELADILIQADLLPAVERGRAVARQADAGAALVSAQDALRSARLQLADQMGVRVDEVALAPLAADAFPAVPEPDAAAIQSSDDWTRQALMARADRLAAEAGVEAARVLEQAASLERWHRHDLQLELSASGLDETSSVLSGVDGAFRGKWVGPSARLSYSYSRPRNNDLAVGQWQQAQASRRQSEIAAGELARQIRSDVINSAFALREAAQQAQYAQQAMALYRQAIANEREKIELGSATVIDLILTEERLTQAALGLISARQRYASSLTQLRFATATLLSGEASGYAVEAASLTSPPGPIANGEVGDAG